MCNKANSQPPFSRPGDVALSVSLRLVVPLEQCLSRPPTVLRNLPGPESLTWHPPPRVRGAGVWPGVLSSDKTRPECHMPSILSPRCLMSCQRGPWKKAAVFVALSAAISTLLPKSQLPRVSKSLAHAPGWHTLAFPPTPPADIHFRSCSLAVWAVTLWAWTTPRFW